MILQSLVSRVIRWKHQLLKLCSKSYREHDAQVARMHELRTKAAEANISAAKAGHDATAVRIECTDLRERLKHAISAQESAAQQLIAERALRQAADERADKYHEELTNALKANVDWLARGLYHRRPMYGVGAPPDEPSTERSDPKPLLHEKPMARQVAKQTTNATLAGLLEEIRMGHEQTQVGPEFTTQ